MVRCESCRIACQQSARERFCARVKTPLKESSNARCCLVQIYRLEGTCSDKSADFANLIVKRNLIELLRRKVVSHALAFFVCQTELIDIWIVSNRSFCKPRQRIFCELINPNWIVPGQQMPDPLFDLVAGHSLFSIGVNQN